MSFENFVEEVQVFGRDLVDKVRDLIHEGNVQRIVVKDEHGNTFIEIPVTVAAVGAVIAPLLAAVGAISALVSKFTIVVVRSEPKSSETAKPAPRPRSGEVLKRSFTSIRRASKYHCDAAIVWCFDNRFELGFRKFLKRVGVFNSDPVKVAGGAKCLASPEHERDREFVLEQLRKSCRLHGTSRVILMLHTDCGAYGGLEAFGRDPRAESGPSPCRASTGRGFSARGDAGSGSEGVLCRFRGRVGSRGGGSDGAGRG